MKTTTNRAAAQAIPNAPAQETLDNLLSEDLDEQESDATAPADEASTAPVTDLSDEDEGEMEEVGGDRVEIFLVHSPGDEGLKANQRLIKKDEPYPGSWLGSFTSGPNNSRTHKVKITAGEYSGKIVGMPTASALDRKFQFAPYGVKTIITFLGENKIKNPNHQFFGKSSFSYSAKMPRRVNEQIAKGLLPKNYDVKDTRKGK